MRQTICNICLNVLLVLRPHSLRPCYCCSKKPKSSKPSTLTPGRNRFGSSRFGKSFLPLRLGRVVARSDSIRFGSASGSGRFQN